VGKTAVAEGIAQLIASGNVPPSLKGYSVWSMDMGSVMAGTKYRGELEEKMKNVIDAVEKKGKVIVFIDEIHLIVGSGNTEVG
jgi:ATP-dependent Clp protease ATP-binding subunit ClpA